LWELSLLAHHFHPSVSMFTAGSGGGISYNGDPLKDFALSPFLDKFAFKNPKSLDKLSKKLKRGENIGERKSGLSGNMALPMNDSSYLESNKIPEEEKFFHQFFVERAKRDDIKGIVRGSAADKKKDDSDLEDEALNATEADEADVVDNLEGDTDSEEEAFVNQLAEKLMESTANGKANLDEEDPDMDDWSDFGDSVSGEEDGNLEDKDDGSKDGNEDSFMDTFSSDDSDEGENRFGSIEGEKRISDGSDGDTNLLFGSLGEDGSDDGSKRLSSKKDDKRKNKNKKPTSIYADAEEYEKILEEESKRCLQEYEDESDPSRKKKKKRTKKH